MTMLRVTARITALATLIALGWLDACSDGPTGPCRDCSLRGLIISNPVVAPSLATSTQGTLALTSGGADSVVYVSLAVGTLPSGTHASIKRLDDTLAITTAVLDGGFDPVPITAQIGDSIEVRVTEAGGAVVFHALLAVAAVRHPIVVRTYPPPRKRDLPLNASIVIVFSEPVAGATVTSTSLQLRDGTNMVPGLARILPGTGSTAAFTPS